MPGTSGNMFGNMSGTSEFDTRHVPQMAERLERVRANEAKLDQLGDCICGRFVCHSGPIKLECHFRGRLRKETPAITLPKLPRPRPALVRAPATGMRLHNLNGSWL